MGGRKRRLLTITALLSLGAIILGACTVSEPKSWLHSLTFLKVDPGVSTSNITNIPGLNVQQISTTLANAPAAISYAVVEKQGAFNRAVVNYARTAEAGFLTSPASSKPAKPDSPTESLVTWEMVVAHEQLLGERIRIVEGAANNTSAKSATFYTYRGSDEAISGTDLFTSQGLDQAHNLVGGALTWFQEHPQATSDALKVPVAELKHVNYAGSTANLFADVSFLPDGSALIVLPQTGLNLTHWSNMGVKIDAQEITKFLSPTGKQLRKVMQEYYLLHPPTPSKAPEQRGKNTAKKPGKTEKPGKENLGPPAQTSAKNSGSNPKAQAKGEGSAAQAPSPSTKPGEAGESGEASGPASVSNQGRGAKVDCAKLSCVALTFDDGPGKYTAQLLTILAKEKVSATFFMVGHSAATQPEIVKQVFKAGHEIGGHSWNHPNLKKMPDDQVRWQIENTSQTLASITGEKPIFTRPPYGASGPKVLAIFKELGQASILWNIDTEDWKNKNPTIITQRALEAHPGSIVLMHDVHETTIAAVPGVIAGLKAKGYRLVTVSQLLGKTQPGREYFSSHQSR